jgi:hypothetical protein
MKNPSAAPLAPLSPMSPVRAHVKNRRQVRYRVYMRTGVTPVTKEIRARPSWAAASDAVGTPLDGLLE